MCYEFDRLYERARAVEQLRKQQKRAEESSKETPAAAPAKPTESEERGTRQEPVPA